MFSINKEMLNPEILQKAFRFKRPHILPAIHRLMEFALKRSGFEHEVRRQGDVKIGIWKRALSATPTTLAVPKRLVFVPGFLDTPLSWLFVMARVLPRLRRHYDEFAILDFPGFAGFLHRDRAFEDMDAITESALDAIDSLRPHTLMGHSLGGYLSALYASECGSGKRPKRSEIKRQGYTGPQKVILTAPSGVFASDHKMNEFMNRFREAVQHGFEALRPYAFFKEPPAFHLISRQFDAILRREDIGTFIHSVRDDHRLNDAVKDLKSDLWLIWGDHDQLVPTECAEAWRERVHDSFHKATVILKNCGHNPQIEKPFALSQIFLRILRHEPHPDLGGNASWMVK